MVSIGWYTEITGGFEPIRNRETVRLSGLNKYQLLCVTEWLILQSTSFGTGLFVSSLVESDTM